MKIIYSMYRAGEVSVHRACCERATLPYSLGGGGTIYPGLSQRGSTVGFLLLQCSSGVVRHLRDLQVSVATRFCRVLIFASS